jgi:hypothetical protein
MRFEKVIACLKTLTEKEKTTLNDYVRSPYFRTPEPVIALYDYLLSTHGAFAQKHLTVEYIAAKQPRLKSKAIQDKAASQLLDTIENMWTQEAWTAEPYAQKLLRIKALKKRQAFDLADRHCKNLEQEINASTERNVTDFEALHLLTEQQQSYFDKQQIGKRLGNIEQIIETLDVYHAIKKIRYTIELLNRQAWQNIHVPTDTIPPLIHLLSPYNNKAHPYIYLFLKIYTLYTEKNQTILTEEYNQLYAYLLQHKNDPLTQTYREVIEYASGHLVLSINKGRLDQAKIYLQLVDLKEHHGLLLKQKYIAPAVYRNIMTVASYTGTSQAWMKQFIDQYTPHLPAEHQPHNHHFALGLLSYSLQHYTDAAHHFSEVKDLNDPILNAIAKRWYFMAAYEHWKNRNALDSALDNFRKYLDNHKDQLKLAMVPSKQFIQYANLLLKSSVKKERQTLHTQLETEAYFPGKDWLLEKMKEK